MAIIRCPECGHEISDKAPFCPSCGVAIAGKVTVCTQCGKAYFSELKECPQCHHKTEDNTQGCQPVGSIVNADTSAMEKGDSSNTEVEEQGVMENPTEGNFAKGHENTEEEEKQQPHLQGGMRSNKAIIAISVIIAIIIVGSCCYFYRSAQIDKENQAYSYAMESTDKSVLQQYLDNYADAPQEHLDSIQVHLDRLKQIDQDWTNALVSESRSSLQQYIEQHPNSPYKIVAMHKIDSIDWNAALAANTVEAIETYLEQHPDGEHIDDAQNSIKKLNTKILQPKEKQMVISVFNSFFKCIEDKDESAAAALVSPIMNNFLGKSNATRSDVVTFMHKIYKSNVSTMKWQLLGDYAINKKEVDDQECEYVVTFSALQSVTSTDNTTDEVKYNISATIDKDGRISDFNMVKILE